MYKPKSNVPWIRAKLSPKEFEKWFLKHDLKGDWEEIYLEIGGIMPEKKVSDDKSSTKLDKSSKSKK